MRNEPDPLKLQRHTVAAVLAAILVGGAFLRVANLGGPDFGVDETFHVYAAERLIAGDRPLLPSGVPYTRSLLFTETVAWAGMLFGEINEWTARVPSVVFGWLTIVLVFFIGRRWYSNAAGLVAAGVTAIAPMQIALSRQVRMYALLQLLYLIAIYLIFQGFETSSPKLRRWIPKTLASWCRTLEIRPGLLICALPILFLAWQVHDLIVPALSGPVVYVVCMALVARYVTDVPVPVRRKYYVAAALLVLAGLVGVGLDLASVREDFARARSYAPTWAQGNVDNWRFYTYAFAGLYPVIFGTFLLSSVFALTRNWKATLYLFACFVLPFLLHSFVFAWKEDRYLFQIMPLMFIVFGVGVSAMLSKCLDSVTAWAHEHLTIQPRLVARTLAIVSVMFMFGATKELREGVKLHDLNVGMFAGVQHYNWKSAMDFVAKRSNPKDVIVTSRTLASLYYGPSLPLYSLNNQELDSILDDYPRDKEGRPLDISTGAPVIIDLTTLVHLVTEHPTGWFVTEQPQFHAEASIPSDVTQFIEQRFHAEVVPDADDMIVYRWGGPAESPGGSPAAP